MTLASDPQLEKKQNAHGGAEHGEPDRGAGCKGKSAIQAKRNGDEQTLTAAIAGEWAVSRGTGHEGGSLLLEWKVSLELE